jgi:MFS transporter, FSR family, fosmidomycin resistance protein
MLIVFKQTLGVSNTQAGLLSLFMQAASLFQPIIGGVADRSSARFFVILAPAVTGIAMSLIGVAPSFLALAILLAISGISSACIHAVGPVLAGKVSGKKLGLGMSIWMVGGEAGRFVGPLIIGALIPLMGQNRMPWLMIGGIVTSIILLFAMPTEVDKRQMAARTKTSLREILEGKERLIVPLVAIQLMYVIHGAALSTFLPVLLHDAGESFWMASASLSILQAAGMVGAFYGGTLSDRLGRKKMIVLSIVPTSALILVFLAVDGWVRLPILVLLGLTSLSIYPVMMALVLESFPNNRALANGAFMALSLIFRSFVVILVGRVGDIWGLPTAFTLAAVVPLLVLPLLRWLPSRNQSQDGLPESAE